MRRTLLLTVAVLLVLFATAAVAQEAAPSRWFSECKGAAYKTADSLESIGVGLALNVYRIAPERSLWLDAAPLYDGAVNVLGGFIGASTETTGIPGLSALAGYVGLGVKLSRDEVTGTAYLATHF